MKKIIKSESVKTDSIIEIIEELSKMEYLSGLTGDQLESIASHIYYANTDCVIVDGKVR